MGLHKAKTKQKSYYSKMSKIFAKFKTKLVVGTGGEVGGQARCFIVFFYIFDRLGQEKSTKIAAKVQTEEKIEK